MDLRSASSNPIQRLLVPLLAWGLQATWVIDPTNGNDEAIGTAAAPLRTMGELNMRLANNVIQQPTTVQVLGNVADALMLNGTVLGPAGTLTVAGEPSAVGTALISSVIALGPSSTFPYTIVTTGIDWTTVTDRRVALPSGDFGWIGRVVDANTIEVGRVGNTSTFSTPTGGQILTVQRLPTMPMPVLQTLYLGPPASFPLNVRDFDFTAGVPYWAAATIRLIGCRGTFSGSQAITHTAIMQARLCLFHTSSGITNLNGGGTGTLTGCVLTGTGFRFSGRTVLSDNFSSGCPLFANGQVNNSALNIRNTATPLSIGSGSLWNQLVTGLAGGSNTGIGITVLGGGGFVYIGAAAKPTLSGASGDTTIGSSVARPYAGSIPYIDAVLDAVPPTVNTLTGRMAYMVQI